jgi:hypothetical protein
MDGNGNAGWSLVERIADESSTIMHCQMKMREEEKRERERKKCENRLFSKKIFVVFIIADYNACAVSKLQLPPNLQ